MDNFTFGQFGDLDAYNAREEFAREEQDTREGYSLMADDTGKVWEVNDATGLTDEGHDPTCPSWMTPDGWIDDEEGDDCEWGPHYGDFYDEDEYHHESSHPDPSDVIGWEEHHDFNWPADYYE